MCGIFFSYSAEEHGIPSERLLGDLKNRGPDSVGTSLRTATFESAKTSDATLGSTKQTCNVTFISTVLSLRGDYIIRQPLQDPKSDFLLCWNGEAWKIDNAVVVDKDTEVVFNLLLNAVQSCNRSDNYESPSLQNILKAIGSITGPYAFVLYDAQSHRVFYGRDALGRRSLLVKRYGARKLALSSVSDATEADGWLEVQADGIYMLDLQACLDSPCEKAGGTLIPWAAEASKSGSPYYLVHSPPSPTC